MRMSAVAPAALALSLAGAAAGAQPLTASEARGIVVRAASEAQRLGGRGTIAVVDAEGTPLAVFRMAGAPATGAVAGQPPRPAADACGREGLEGLAVPAERLAVGKAATAALLSTRGTALSTRTLGFLVQDHFPPDIDFTPGGPMYGQQLSSLSCSDLGAPGTALGFSADPGGVPLYRDGTLVGGVGVEGDGVYGGGGGGSFGETASWEEAAALAGASDFAAPDDVRAEKVVLDGIRLPFAGTAPSGAAVAEVEGSDMLAPRAAGPSRLVPLAVAGSEGTTLPGLAPRGGSVLSAAEVTRVIEQALHQAARTRSAVRHPLNSPARVTVAVVDVGGAVLGLFRAPDAPLFGLDAAVQSARTAAFFSGAPAQDQLLRAGMAAFAQGVPLDGSVAYTSRAIGFLAQPFLPPGVSGGDPGPFSVPPPPVWSPFHTGLQVELLCDALGSALADAPTAACTRAAGLGNGIALAPGGVPLYRDGRLAGAVGVSGDGPDQDDLIAAAAAAGFEAPAERRSDRVLVRGVRLPYLKFPRHPEL